VEIPIATSPARPNASIWRANTRAKSESLAMLVRMEVSVVRASAASAGRSTAKRLTNSAARCCASAALPPLPKNRRVPPDLRAATNAAATASTVEASPAKKRSAAPACSR